MSYVPDFEVIAQQLVIRHCCSMQPIEVGITEELKNVFDLGRELGFQEGREISNTEEWWEHQDAAKLTEDDTHDQI